MWTDKELDAVVIALRLQFSPYVPHWRLTEWEAVAASVLETAEVASNIAKLEGEP